MPRRKKSGDPRWSLKQKPATGDLRIVQAFLNTADADRKSDLASPRALADWLELWGLAPPGTTLDADDLERALRVRQALRGLVAAQNRNVPAESAAVRLDQELTAAMVRIRFAADGRARYEPVPNGLDAALARLCGIVVAAQHDGSWFKLKFCFDKNCRGVFEARQSSAIWCSHQCCSRSTSQKYRNRHGSDYY